MRFETLQVHAGQEKPDESTGARAVPIYQTTSYVFRDCKEAADRFSLASEGNIYGRLTNPTQEVLEQRIAALEGGSAALAVASGAAAIAYTLEALGGRNGHIVAASTIYGGTYNLLAHTLPEFGITATFVNPDEKGAFEHAIKENTKAIFLETLGNPNSNIIDLEAVAKLAHAHGIPVVVDNTFATPYLFRPLEHGADLVVHSATKFMGGHGSSLGGVIVEGGSFDWEASNKFKSLTVPNPSYHGVSFVKAAPKKAFVTMIRAVYLRDLGAAIAPLNAFLILSGLETLSLRVERHVENARRVVEYLSNNPLVEKVNHPLLPDSPYHALYKRYFPKGAGSIFTFEIKGGETAAKAFIDRLKIFSLLANVADVKSLVIHPASTTHAQMTEEELLESGIKPGTIRLSVGTEHIEDILWDLQQAFDGI